ncbi:MAG: pseudouridine synthase [Gemmatimonadota bacterium]
MIEETRLQKYLARAGVASRRACEELIAAGRVRVDGEVVLRPGTRVGPESVVEVDGRRVEPSLARWIALHKPPGYVCAREDPQGRPTVYDLLPADLRPLFHVGRLDIMSEGLLLLTNEGEAAHRLLHPSSETPRRYQVVLVEPPPADLTDRLLAGVELEDGLAAADEARLDPGRGRGGATLQLELHEGRNREVRRMMKALGVKIRSLKRLALGPIELGRLRPGEWRDLSEKEIATLRGDPTG